MKRRSCVAEEAVCPPQPKKSKVEPERKGLLVSLFLRTPCYLTE